MGTGYNYYNHKGRTLLPSEEKIAKADALAKEQGMTYGQYYSKLLAEQVRVRKPKEDSEE